MATHILRRSGWTARAAALVFALPLALVLAPVGASGNPQRPLASMPEAPAKQLISAKCGTCHEISRVFDRTRTKSDWTDVMVLMRDFGADFSHADQKVMVEYLAQNYGRAEAPRQPAPAPRAAAAPAVAAKPAPSSSNMPTANAPASASSAPAPAAKPAAAAASNTGGASADAGKALVDTKCTMCHNTDVISSTRRSRQEWAEVVDMMRDFGADVSESDGKVIVDYLAKTYGR